MASQQLTDATGNPEAFDGRRKFFSRNRTKSGQCVDHWCCTAHDLCSACVSSELSMAREVSNNNSRQNPQNNIQHDGCNVITDSGGIAFVTENCSVNEVSDNSGEKYHECVCDALNKSQSNHITVGNVSNFMSEHCFYFFFIHAGEKTG